MSSSWRPRKYHGAFDGFGVRLMLASSSSGALTKIEKTSSEGRARQRGHELDRRAGAATCGPCPPGWPYVLDGARLDHGEEALGVTTRAGGRPAAGRGGDRRAAAGRSATATPPPPLGSRRLAAGRRPWRPRLRSRRWAGILRRRPRTWARRRAPARRRRRRPRPAAASPLGRGRLGAGLFGPLAEVFGDLGHGASASHHSGPGDAAVLADPPEVDGHEDDDHEREHQHVQHVPAQQRLGADLRAAEEHEAHLVAEHRRVAHHVRAHGHRPQRQLVPRQQVAGEGQQQGERQQDDADHPVELTGRLVGAVVEDARHVQEHRQHHEVRAPIGACCARGGRR